MQKKFEKFSNFEVQQIDFEALTSVFEVNKLNFECSTSNDFDTLLGDNVYHSWEILAKSEK